jgi:hypothetical protein
VKTEVSPLRGPLIQMATGVAVTLAVLGTAWFSSTFGPQPTPVPLPPAPIIEVIEEVDPPTPLVGPDAPVPVGGIAEFSIPASVVNPQWLIVPEVPYRCYESHDDPHKIVLETASPGTYRVIVAGIDDESVSSILWHRELTVGPKVIPPEPGPDPPRPDEPAPPTPADPSKITAVTYVYEKDEGPVPAAVNLGLVKLNKLGILATEFEQNVFDGERIPKPYEAALARAKSEGLPCLVVLADSTVVRALPDRKESPLTEAKILEAAR